MENTHSGNTHDHAKIAGPGAVFIDPVCGMKVVAEEAKGKTEYRDKIYYFCSPKCKTKFDADPKAYVFKQAEPVIDNDAEKNRIYTCPMHPQIRQKGPGNCPICGMTLEPEEVSLEEETNPELVDFTRRLKISAALAIPLLFLAMSDLIPGQPVQHSLPHAWNAWIQFLLATPVVLWAGRPFFQRGWASLKTGNFNMFTLIALGTGVAYVFSLVGTFYPQIFPESLRSHGGMVPLYYEASAVITALVLLGQVLELRARSQTGNAIRALLGLAAKTAKRIKADGTEEDVSVEQIHVGDLLRVKPGEKIPVDGEVNRGPKRR